MSKILKGILIATLMITVFTGCSSGDVKKDTQASNNTSEAIQEQGVDNVELTFFLNRKPDLGITIAIEEVIEDFEAEHSNIDVELVTGVGDYEAVMKTKMGANDLPDLWATHGWSVIRYSEYLRPLTDQPWANKLNPGIEKVITDKNGDIFVLPMNIDLSGIVYNVDVINEAGVDVDAIATWDDFRVACQKIKDAGFTPIHMGGKDYWTVGNFFDWVAPSFYITDENSNDRSALKDGSFDWSKWDRASELLLDLDASGFLNKDKLSSNFTDSARNLALGKVGFEFYGNYVIGEALRFNEEANLSFMPVPSDNPNDPKTLISGERDAFGVWKDTPNEAEALLLLEYFSRPEVMSKIATASTLPAGLKDVDSDTGKLKEAYSKYSDLRGFPYFDRVYLPSGMWETIESTSTGLLAKDMTAEEVHKKMETDYLRLIKQ